MNETTYEYGTTLSGWKISTLKVIEGEVVWARDFLPPQRDGRTVTRWLDGQAVHRIEVTIVQPSGHWSKGPIEWEVRVIGSATPIAIITGFGETLFHAKVTLARRVKQFWINTGVERPGYFPSL
jgi:hypothetical protein